MKIKEAKNYDAWLRWTPTNRCNLNCGYCSNLSAKNTGRMLKIDIPKLIKSLDKTEKIYKISFTGGGEPFLVPNLVEACRELTKKHYISLLTNLTLPKIKEFAEKVNPEKVLNIIASAHIGELERCGLLTAYMNNFLLLRRGGFSIEAKAVAHPSLSKDADRYRQLFKEKGIELRFSPLSMYENNGKYPYKYNKEELETFGLRNSDYESRIEYYKPPEVCNASYNTAAVDSKGNICICESIKIKIGNIYGKINFRESPIICPLMSCRCPIYHYDPYLHEKAREGTIEAERIRRAALYLSQGRDRIRRYIGMAGIYLRRRYQKTQRDTAVR